MDIVQMNLMQAQIGSLATDLARLEAKVAKGGGGGGGVFLIKQTEPGSLDKTFDEIKEAIIEGKVIQLASVDAEEGTTYGYIDTTFVNAYYSIVNELITLDYPVTIYQNGNLVISRVTLEVTSDNITYQPYTYTVSATPVS